MCVRESKKKHKWVVRKVKRNFTFSLKGRLRSKKQAMLPCFSDQNQVMLDWNVAQNPVERHSYDTATEHDPILLILFQNISALLKKSVTGVHFKVHLKLSSTKPNTPILWIHNSQKDSPLAVGAIQGVLPPSLKILTVGETGRTLMTRKILVSRMFSHCWKCGVLDLFHLVSLVFCQSSFRVQHRAYLCILADGGLTLPLCMLTYKKIYN